MSDEFLRLMHGHHVRRSEQEGRQALGLEAYRMAFLGVFGGLFSGSGRAGSVEQGA